MPWNQLPKKVRALPKFRPALALHSQRAVLDARAPRSLGGGDVDSTGMIIQDR